MSNVFLADRVRAKDRMRALTATTHLVDEEHLRTIHGWPWYKRIGFFLRELIAALVKR
jgi:hypothetical protein